MKKQTKAWWLIAKGAVLAALMLAVLWRGVNTVSVSAVISMIIAAIVVGFLRWKRTAEVSEGDERTKKLGAYAATYSWLLTLVLIAVLFWVDYFTVVKMTVAQALGTTLFVMVLSMNMFRWYFYRLGDVE
jgi:UDP-N-acetylmuramyl pentapeptide phosphotransferase/UDP-N-acetylglucosamine-1-phosphate transferase